MTGQFMHLVDGASKYAASKTPARPRCRLFSLRSTLMSVLRGCCGICRSFLAQNSLRSSFPVPWAKTSLAPGLWHPKRRGVVQDRRPEMLPGHPDFKITRHILVKADLSLAPD